jgi:hypothetical protein
MRIAPLAGDFVVVEEPSLAIAARELWAEVRATAESSGNPHACPEGLWFVLLGIDPRDWQEKAQNIYETELILICEINCRGSLSKGALTKLGNNQ